MSYNKSLKLCLFRDFFLVLCRQFIALKDVWTGTEYGKSKGLQAMLMVLLVCIALYVNDSPPHL